MHTIHKYMVWPLNGDRLTVSMPQGAKILNVDLQRGWPNLWAQVDTGKPLEDVTIIAVGTGHEMPAENVEYISTTFSFEDTLVLHWFRVVK